jgi:enoyl-CoA hydratase
VGIYIYGTHRVAGENFRFSMPETGLGFFPDVGGSYFLSRLPGEMGVYLGLTGETVGPADAWHLGLVSHYIPSSDFDMIHNALVESEPIDPFLDELNRDPGTGPLAVLMPVIDRVFSGATMEEIFARLDGQTGEYAEWAQKTAAALRKRAPLSLKVTLRQIREGGKLPRLKEALAMEFRLASRFLAGHDFREGIRAAMIDKDQAPRWQHASLSEVTDTMVDAYFAPLGEGELALKDYWTLDD